MVDTIVWWLIVASGVGFAITALLALIRMIFGPSILDRMIASDVFVTTLMLVVGAEMVIHKHTNTVGLMVLLASTSVFATIMVARYVRRRPDQEPLESGDTRA